MRSLIWYFIIVLLLGLNVYIFVNGINLSCDKCVITFKNEKISGVPLKEPILVAEIKASDLFEDYQNGYCTIMWDKTQGFHK